MATNEEILRRMDKQEEMLKEHYLTKAEFQKGMRGIESKLTDAVKESITEHGGRFDQSDEVATLKADMENQKKGSNIKDSIIAIVAFVGFLLKGEY